jgi:hypothetical protein
MGYEDSFTTEETFEKPEANHSLPSSAEVKDAWSFTSTPTYDGINQTLVGVNTN